MHQVCRVTHWSYQGWSVVADRWTCSYPADSVAATLYAAAPALAVLLAFAVGLALGRSVG